MKLKSIFALLAVSMATGGCVYNPKVLGTTVPRDAFCPSAGKYCTESIGDIRAISITKTPRYLAALPDGMPNVWTYLGREYTRDASQIVNFCGNQAVNPFQTYAASVPAGTKLVIDDVASNSVSFTRKASTRRSFAADIDVTKLLNAAGVPTDNSRIKAEAAIRSALAKLDKSEIQMSGRYSFVYLEPSILALLKVNGVPPALQACSAALKQGAAPIISSMTLAKIDTLTSATSFKNDASASLEASLKGKVNEAVLAQIKSEFEKSVEDTFATSFSPTWQVLSIAGYSGK